MEEEYRMQKQTEATSQSASASKVIHEDGTVVSSPRRGASLQGKAADDDASTRGVVSPSQSPPAETDDAAKDDADEETLVAANGIPTIRISTESALEAAAEEAKANGDAEAVVKDAKEEETNGANGNGVAGDSLEKPVQAAENQDGDGGQSPSQEPFSFSNKRLCERWLDNLFMVLYEVGSLLPSAAMMR